MIQTTDYIEDAKYKALVQTNEKCITDDGYQYYETILVTSDNLEALRRFLGNYAYCWDKGYVWEGDLNEDDPMYFLERECDEKTNKWLNRLILVPYVDVENFEGHTWEDIDAFRDEVAEIQENGCLAESGLFYGNDDDNPPEWEEGMPLPEDEDEYPVTEEEIIDDDELKDDYSDPELDPYKRTDLAEYD